MPQLWHFCLKTPCAGVALHVTFFFIYLLILGINAWKVGGAELAGPGRFWRGPVLRCAPLPRRRSAHPRGKACTHGRPAPWPGVCAELPHPPAGLPSACAQVFVGIVPLLGAASFAVGSSVKQAVDASVFLFVVRGRCAPACLLGRNVAVPSGSPQSEACVFSLFSGRRLAARPQPCSALPRACPAPRRRTPTTWGTS